MTARLAVQVGFLDIEGIAVVFRNVGETIRAAVKIVSAYADANIPGKAGLPDDGLATVVALKLLDIEGDPDDRDSVKLGAGAREFRNGVPLRSRSAQSAPVTVGLVNRLRDEDE